LRIPRAKQDQRCLVNCLVKKTAGGTVNSHRESIKQYTASAWCRSHRSYSWRSLANTIAK